jgi:peptide deformylase
MSLLKIARLGHPVLRRKAEAVPPKEIPSPDMQRLVDDMVQTMREADGVGLAANQIHVPRQLIVFEVAGERRDRVPLTVLFNPKLLSSSRDQEEDWEGCLSVPDLRGRVTRATEVRVRGCDRTGKEVEIAAAGLAARVLQHEMDHLAGAVFLDRMKDLSTLTFLDEYARYWERRPGR